MNLLTLFRPTPPLAPEPEYQPIDATLACMLACLAYRHERNADGFAYTFDELNRIANRHLLSWDAEWVGLLRTMERDTKTGASYRAAGCDEFGAPVAVRIAPGVPESADWSEPDDSRVAGIVRNVARALGVVATLVVCVWLRGHWS